jgi:hypothetical protein
MTAISDVERISAELAVRNLIAKIFLLTDTAPDLDDYRECFTEDAIWERVGEGAGQTVGPHTTGRAVGRETIVADRQAVRKVNHTGPTTANWHMATNVHVAVTSRDTARAWTSWIFVYGEEGAPRIRSVGYYQDDFRRTDSGWKLAHRRFAMGKPPAEFSPQGAARAAA